MTKTYVIKVLNCNTCPNHGSSPYYTADSFETESNYFCKAKGNKRLGTFDWKEERNIKIPSWCPLEDVK